MEIKAYKRGTLTGYWKNETWEQPALTSNIDSPLMQVSASNEGQYPAYLALDGNTDTGWATANNVTSATLTIKLSEIIHITKIEVLGLTNQYGHTSTVTINGEQKSFDYVTSSTVFFEYDDYATKEIVLNVTGVTWCTIQDIQITATKIIEGTPEDYDFTTQENKYFAFKANVRKYYKYDTSNPVYNITPNGNLTNTDGVLSGFTSSIYGIIQPPFIPLTNTWEIVFKFTTGTNISSEQYVFASQRGVSGASHGIFFEIKSSKIWMQGSTSGSSWNINTGSTTTLTTNTTYWVKGVFDGSTYKMYLSTDGANYTQEGLTVTNSNPIYLTTVVTRIGVYGNAAGYPFNGTVDLKESYIKIGGGYWWKGVDYPIITGTSSDYDFYKDEDVYSAFNV